MIGLHMHPGHAIFMLQGVVPHHTNNP